MEFSQDCEQEKKQPSWSIPLSHLAIEVLRGLFIEGPLFDGDVPSKSGRDELVRLGLAMRYDGWQSLTRQGLEMAIANKLDRDKERTYRERRKATHLLHVVDQVMRPPELLKKATIKEVMREVSDCPTRDSDV